ncbi:hypothetical protein TRP66_11355 [Pseudomonas sp. JDS28PS106]|uniref:hypothetical protein n=1 Tax=Pseudomonas sp. JDS28PS106 TaxID=2497235 RepID=UPI002FD33EB1
MNRSFCASSNLDPKGTGDILRPTMTDRQLSAKSSHCVDTEWDAVGVLSNKGSNLSFTATFIKHNPLIFLDKIGGLWFLASKK